MAELLALSASGRIKGVIKTRPFNEIDAALNDLNQGRVEGRIVLTMEGGA
jgi:D-arabinose 1-dehydrogenase-like Zn-dependent alcohol dehydrogenase